MCDQCDQLDVKIERYRRLSTGTTDSMVREAAAKLIEELNAEKAKLHPEQDK
jgi:hypothetical protein